MNKPYNSQQAELWSQKSRDWADFQEPKNKPLWEVMMAGSLVGTGTRFLDVGCGGGGASLLAHARGAHVTGIDVAHGMVEVARERLPEQEFHVGDIEALPFADESFDVVFAANSIQFSENWQQAVRELARVCHKRGRITAGLFASPEKVAFSEVLAAIRSVLPESPNGGGPFELSSPGKLEALFIDAGLDIVEVNEIDCPFVYADFSSFWQSTQSAGPFQALLRRVEESVLVKVLQQTVKPYTRVNGEILIGPNAFKYVIAAKTA